MDELISRNFFLDQRTYRNLQGCSAMELTWSKLLYLIIRVNKEGYRFPMIDGWICARQKVQAAIERD